MISCFWHANRVQDYNWCIYIDLVFFFSLAQKEGRVRYMQKGRAALVLTNTRTLVSWSFVVSRGFCIVRKDNVASERSPRRHTAGY